MRYVLTNHTDGHRIYAIGDIHGWLNKLSAVQTFISEDLKRRPHPSPVIVYIGDYIDRGPDSKGVIDNLIIEQASAHRTHFMLGNHDKFFSNYILDPELIASSRLHWFSDNLGGTTTIESYGIEGANHENPAACHGSFVKVVPQSHHDFLGSLELSLQIGSYVFVHAGIRPETPLCDQTEHDLTWIREPFLSSDIDHGFTVVHGHTPTRTVENRGNRIGIDTGAAFDRNLSCLVLEDDRQNLLAPDGLLPCPVT